VAPAGEQSGAARGLSKPRGAWVRKLDALQITGPPHSGPSGRPSEECFVCHAAGVVEQAALQPGAWRCLPCSRAAFAVY
jgi:hypothetical protein